MHTVFDTGSTIAVVFVEVWECWSFHHPCSSFRYCSVKLNIGTYTACSTKQKDLNTWCPDGIGWRHDIRWCEPEKSFDGQCHTEIMHGLFLITSCMNFLQTGRISLLRVALNIITCFSCGVFRKISWTSDRISDYEHLCTIMQVNCVNSQDKQTKYIAVFHP